MELAEARDRIAEAVADARRTERITIVCTDGTEVVIRRCGRGWFMDSPHGGGRHRSEGTRVSAVVRPGGNYCPTELVIVIGPYGGNQPDGIRPWGTLHLSEHDVETVEVSRLSWDAVELHFPQEAALRDRIVDYVREHPGAYMEELREAVRPRSDVGLVVVVCELAEDGRIELATSSVAGRIYATMEAGA